ncbi:methyl-accepting chemotaxis protein [Vibrio sp.]|uniref:PAS domain S-box protein n=1 Tax=Vibrio viridaestus TaxID=2487322 RepID=A0A3N9TDB6_9VIBR|nr:PAS domain-containing methyl-accepting chemotaxis protein [Vibrio viridaestus]MDC0611461.1 methyl-accepting chemotaxis protein [Vibrio sp.]RQW61844.1 PAS domain S-box protein [Vibrio viridaestus]
MGKRNQSVIDEEVTFGENEELVSTTDLRGVISYANEKFCDIAGFTLEELTNKNHNIVRHPDMPSAAFKDMWDHLKRGENWRGAVKNRCKDGRYYWVDAYVTPIYENGQLIGYQSVRRKLSKEVRERAEAFYAAINRGAKVDRFASLKTVPFKIAVFILLSVVAGLGATHISPYFYVLTPLLAILVFWVELFKKPVQEQKMKSQYDSVSRYVYNQDPTDIADFHMKIYDGKVKTILGRVIDSAQVMKTKAQALDTEAMNSMKNVEQEAIELESVATAMEEMVATIDEVAKNSATSSDQVSKASVQCDNSVKQMNSARSKIESLVHDVDESTQSTLALSTKLDSVGSLMNEIQGIAEQTNLLALNAAIEAARAGEQGRGFAVVADEVRALSQRTHTTTENIQETMGQVSTALTKLVSTMEKGQSSAKVAVENAEEITQSINQLQDIMLTISDASMQISTATEQQSAVAKEINVNLSSIRDASQDNLRGAKLVSSLSGDIQERSANLSSLSRSFK